MFDSQVGEEGGDFCRAHIAGMAHMMKADKARNPVGVRFLGADGIVFETQHIADLIQQFARFFGHRFLLELTSTIC